MKQFRLRTILKGSKAASHLESNKATTFVFYAILLAFSSNCKFTLRCHVPIVSAGSKLKHIMKRILMFFSLLPRVKALCTVLTPSCISLSSIKAAYGSAVTKSPSRGSVVLSLFSTGFSSPALQMMASVTSGKVMLVQGKSNVALQSCLMA